MAATAVPRPAPAGPSVRATAGSPIGGGPPSPGGPRNRGGLLNPKFNAFGPAPRSTSPRLVVLAAASTSVSELATVMPWVQAGLHTSAPSPPKVAGWRRSSAAKAV